jgi:hypothetical protein
MAEPLTHLSKAAFGRRHGVGRTRVTQWIQRGLPVEGGKIPVEAGDRWVSESLDPKRRNPAATISESARRIEAAKARRLELQLAREVKALVPREQAERAIFARARAERDAHRAWVLRAAPVLAAELGADARKTFEVLDRLMSEHLDDLAKTPLVDLTDA